MKPKLGVSSPTKTSGTSNHIVHSLNVGSTVGVQKVTREYDNSFSYIKGLKDNNELLTENNSIKLVGFYSIVDKDGQVKRSANGIPQEVLIGMLTVSEDVTIDEALKIQGQEVANAYPKYTKPYMKGNKVIGKPIACYYAYCENDQPYLLSDVIGVKGAASVITQLYFTYMKDGTFWDQCEEIVKEFMGDFSIEEAKKMIRFEFEKINA